MQKPLLDIQDLHVSAGDTSILDGVSLVIQPGEIHLLMGRNGQGKSTIAQALAGAPAYHFTQGKACLQGEDILGLSPEQRAAKGLFIAFQQSIAIPGVSVINFLKASIEGLARIREEQPMSAPAILSLVKEKMATIKLPPSFLSRSLNDGFSGGEKKRLELLQMMVLDPCVAILDETDSGLDTDALRILGETIRRLQNPKKGFLIITHYTRFLDYITPDYVHIVEKGRIIHTGRAELAKKLSTQGYDPLLSSLTEKK